MRGARMLLALAVLAPDAGRSMAGSLVSWHVVSTGKGELNAPQETQRGPSAAGPQTQKDQGSRSAAGAGRLMPGAGRMA